MTVDIVDTKVIRTEDDAWIALNQAMTNEIGENIQLSFDGWPTLKITLEGNDFNCTMPTRIMQPILDLQTEIYRIYCRSKYNDDSTRRLTDEDRKLLELIVEIKPGSSQYITQIGKALNEIIKSSKMNGKQVLILLVSVSALICSDSMWKAWLQSKEKEHNLDLSVALTHEETERLKIVTQAMQQNSNIVKTNEALDEIRNELAKK